MPFMHDTLEFARRHTRILKSRQNTLFTFGPTKLPYLCLTAARGEVIIRGGEVVANKPKIMLPGQDEFQLSGFDSDEMEKMLSCGALPIVMARNVQLPNMAYENAAGETRRVSGSIDDAAEKEVARLAAENDSRTGVICAPEKVWQLSLIIYVSQQIAKSSAANLNEHFERLRFNNE
jgi:hypothetical protein